MPAIYSRDRGTRVTITNGKYNRCRATIAANHDISALSIGTRGGVTEAGAGWGGASLSRCGTGGFLGVIQSLTVE